MARKKGIETDTAPVAEPSKPEETNNGTDNHGPQAPAPSQTTEPGQKQWSNPYSSIFTCVVRGFELGEDRRYKQRVFKFTEKPSQDIIDTLKENGFKYRPQEKTWTISANPDTRLLTDQLARQFAVSTPELAR